MVLITLLFCTIKKHDFGDAFFINANVLITYNEFILHSIQDGEIVSFTYIETLLDIEPLCRLYALLERYCFDLFYVAQENW